MHINVYNTFIQTRRELESPSQVLCGLKCYFPTTFLPAAEQIQKKEHRVVVVAIVTALPSPLLEVLLSSSTEIVIIIRAEINGYLLKGFALRRVKHAGREVFVKEEEDPEKKSFLKSRFSPKKMVHTKYAYMHSNVYFQKKEEKIEIV